MKELSNIIYKMLVDANIKFIGKRIYPIVANSGAKFPFIVYKVNIAERLSKERAYRYNVAITVFTKDYTTTLDTMETIISDILPAVNYDGTKYRFNIVNTDVNFDHDDEVFVGEIISKIIKK